MASPYPDSTIARSGTDALGHEARGGIDQLKSEAHGAVDYAASVAASASDRVGLEEPGTVNSGGRIDGGDPSAMFANIR